MYEYDMLSAVPLATSVDDAWSEWFRFFSEAISNNDPRYVVKEVELKRLEHPQNFLIAH